MLSIIAPLGCAELLTVVMVVRWMQKVPRLPSQAGLGACSCWGINPAFVDIQRPRYSGTRIAHGCAHGICAASVRDVAKVR